MVDVRLYLREKYRPMRPAEWQAAQKPRNLPPRTAPTPQDRDDDPGPEVLQSDEEEVDHPPTKRHKLERLKHPRLKSFYEPEARLRVERFLADDFQTPYATRAQIHEWYEKFSAVSVESSHAARSCAQSSRRPSRHLLFLNAHQAPTPILHSSAGATSSSSKSIARRPTTTTSACSSTARPSRGLSPAG